MYVTTIEVLPIRDGERVSATVSIEDRRGGSWSRSETRTVLSGEPEASRRIVLRDDQRLVIEGKSDTEVRFDPVQKAAVPVTVPQAVEEGVFDEQRRQEIENEEAAEHVRLKAINQAKTRLRNNSRAND